MTRRKVKTEVIKDEGPKKRPTKQPVQKSPVKASDDKPVRWDKIEGVSGKIVRVKLGDQAKSAEMGNMVMKGNARRLYVGVDGNDTYFYYEVIKE